MTDCTALEWQGPAYRSSDMRHVPTQFAAGYAVLWQQLGGEETRWVAARDRKHADHFDRSREQTSMILLRAIYDSRTGRWEIGG